MTPTWNTPDGAIRLYLGDCRNVLRTSEADACIADPPYGIRYSPSQNSEKAWGPKTFHGECVVSGDDEPFDPTPLLRFKTVVLCGGNHYANLLPASSEWVIWDKRDGITSNDFADCEMIWTNRTGVSRLYRHYWCGALRASERGVPRVHPTQKPVALMCWLVERYTTEGQSVIDPYMGSGTTGVACARLGRNFIGCEINEDHFHAAVCRIESALTEPRLFPAAPVKETQTLLEGAWA